MNILFCTGLVPESSLVRLVHPPRALSHMATVANVTKRRGVARAFLTRLVSRVKKLEHQPRGSTTPDLADRMAKKLVELDADFRAQHHALIDLIEEEEALEREHKTLDAHDNLVTELSVRIKRIISTSSPVSDF